MGFGSPQNLLYLAALPVLVLIYLRARSRRNLEVSSLRLFEEVLRVTPRGRRFQTDRLFWLEAATLSALVLALSGAYLKHRTASAGPARLDTLVFDLGASMGAQEGGQSRLDRAKQEAFQILARAAPDDRFSVIAYALEAELRHAESADRASIKASVAALAPVAVAPRPAALRAALMRAGGPSRIDLFTDRAVPETLMRDPVLSPRLHVHLVGAPAENFAIAALDPGMVNTTPGMLTVRNFSDSLHTIGLEISVPNERIKTSATIPPRSQAFIRFGPLKHGGLVHARIATPDALAADNDRYAYTEGSQGRHALVVSPSAEVRADLSRILIAVDPQLSVIAVEPEQLRAGHEPYDLGAGQRLALVVMHDCYVRGIRAGARLIIFPSREVMVHLPVRVGRIVEHAQLRVAGFGGEDRLLVLGRARMIEPGPGVETLASGAAGSGMGTPAGAASSAVPMVVLGNGEAGRFAVVAFDVRNHLLLDPDRAGALIATVNLMKRLLAPLSLRIVSTGSWVRLPSAAAVRLLRPDGTATTLRPDGQRMVHFQALLAGRYRVEKPGEQVEVMANYYDAAESDLAAYPRASALAPAGDTQSPAFSVPTGATSTQPLGGLLMAFALALFVIETGILIARAPGRGKPHDV